MKKQLQLQTFQLRPGSNFQQDLHDVNNYLRNADVKQAFAVNHHNNEGAILLFLEINGREKEGEIQSESVNGNHTLTSVLTTEQLLIMERIKAWRSAKAAELQLPVFMVINNMAIEQIARELPENLTQLTALKGMGPVRSSKYGNELLSLIQMTVRSDSI